jgi:hypothetical protein
MVQVNQKLVIISAVDSSPESPMSQQLKGIAMIDLEYHEGDGYGIK